MVDYINRRVVIRKKFQSTNTWESEKNGIVLGDTYNVKTTFGLGKKRDTFNFDVLNHNNSLYENFYSGDGTTTAFTLKYSPIPAEHLSGNDKKFDVYVDGNIKIYTTDYSVSGSTITFVSAPASGNRNIRIVYPIIEADDLVDIHFFRNAEWDSLSISEKENSRKIEGVIITPSLSYGSDIVSVRGYGLMDVIFSGMAFALFDNDTVNKAHLVIQQIISQLNKYNPNRKIYGGDSEEWIELGNSTTSEDITYTSKYRSAIEMIEELSGNKYTGDGQYIYYIEYNSRSSTADGTSSNKLIDSTASFTSGLSGMTIYNETDDTSTTISAVDSSTQLSLSDDIFVSGDEYSIPSYDFHWKTKPITSTETITEGVEPNSIKISKSVEDVVNVVIYNCGTDPYGRGMEYLNYDFTITGYGARWKYVSTTSTIGQDIVVAEFEADESLWDTTPDGNRESNFPKSTSYPWTFQFETRDSYGAKTGTKATASNDNEFADAVRLEAKWRGKFKTDDIMHLYSNPRFKTTLFIPHTSDFSPVLGNVYNLVFPSFGLNGKKLRLIQIDYEFYGKQLIFEEDEKTLAN